MGRCAGGGGGGTAFVKPPGGHPFKFLWIGALVGGGGVRVWCRGGGGRLFGGARAPRGLDPRCRGATLSRSTHSPTGPRKV